MAFNATTANTRIFPLRDYDEHEVINFFSKNVTGVAGELVKIIRSTPSEGHKYSAGTLGASYSRVTNLTYETTDKVQATQGGRFTDTAYNVLGLTLNATLQNDENGKPLWMDQNRREELQAVTSGEAIPVLRRGVIGVYQNGYVGTPTVGFVVVPHSGGNGMLHFIDPTVIAFFNDTGTAAGASYNANQVIGKCLSSSGNEFGGYAVISLEL